MITNISVQYIQFIKRYVDECKILPGTIMDDSFITEFQKWLAQK